MITKCISIYLFIGVMLFSFIFVNSFVRSKSSYARALGALSLTLQVYLLGYLMEINSGSVSEMYFWNQVQYFGLPFFSPLWLIIAMLYTGRGRYLKGFGGVIVFAIPVMTFVFRLTNNWHHLYYSNFQIQHVMGIDIMLLTKGPWYYVQTLYIMFALLLCTWFYFQHYRKSVGDEKTLFKLLLLISIIPYLSLVLIVLNIGGVGIDYTALILPPCVLLFNLALTRYNFLDIRVLARERVFEESVEGLILVNRMYYVVDFNAASVAFFSWFNAQIEEEQLEILIKNHPDLLKSIKDAVAQVFCFIVAGEERYVSVQVREVNNKKVLVGYLIKFEDVTEREKLKQRLIKTANTDGLTGLNNRRKFGEYGKEAFLRARRYHEDLSVLMMDIDYFKRVNDSFGHQGGDVVLRGFSDLLSVVFRKTDIVGRVGGEEFAVIMLNTDVGSACEKAEIFRKTVAEKKLTFAEKPIMITVSIGVAELTEEMSDFEVLMNRADNALYAAKRSGRNRVVRESLE